MVSFGTFVTKAMSQNAFVLVGEKKKQTKQWVGILGQTHGLFFRTNPMGETLGFSSDQKVPG